MVRLRFGAFLVPHHPICELSASGRRLRHPARLRARLGRSRKHTQELVSGRAPRDLGIHGLPDGYRASREYGIEHHESFKRAEAMKD
jgi:hypothetical protein